MNAATSAAPRWTLDRTGGRARLMRDGRRWLVRGIELHNSSSSTVESIEEAFAAIRGRSINTVLAAVSWELVEPREGEFDFALVDALLATARAEGVALVPLWFGTWKNGASSYTPSWVKRDQRRFPRAVDADGIPLEHISAFGSEIAAADARAFAAFMAHLRNHDTEGVVAMVQVENEVGLLGASRDLSEPAERAWAAPVPEDVRSVVNRGGMRITSSASESGASWAELYGDSDASHEAFMAAGIARHVGVVAAAGRAEFEVPLFVNAWLDSEIDIPGLAPAGGQRPGIYPSGGPLPHVAAIWQALAPALDFLAPDFYFGNFDEVCTRFGEASDALFIPEMRGDESGAAQAIHAIGAFGALGASPFGGDSHSARDAEALADAYRMLMTWAASTDARETVGFHLDDGEEHNDDTVFTFGPWSLTMQRARDFMSTVTTGRAYGLITRISEDRFIALGRGFELVPAHDSGAPARVLSAEELDGGDTVRVARVLNGDETRAGAAITHPARRIGTESDFPMATSEPGTGVTRFELYTVGASTSTAP